jgi:hypothetical protein
LQQIIIHRAFSVLRCLHPPTAHSIPPTLYPPVQVRFKCTHEKHDFSRSIELRTSPAPRHFFCAKKINAAALEKIATFENCPRISGSNATTKQRFLREFRIRRT